MNVAAVESYGWGGHEDSDGTVSGMGAIVSSMGEVSAPDPSPGFPVTGDARQQAANNPAQVRLDAANLRRLDYPAPDTGNAYDPKFRAAVLAFQTKAGPSIVGAADGLIGPQTRGALEDMVRSLGGGTLPVPLPPNVLPNVIPTPDVKPVVSETKSNTGLIVGGVVGALALLGIGWWALSD